MSALRRRSLEIVREQGIDYVVPRNKKFPITKQQYSKNVAVPKRTAPLPPKSPQGKAWESELEEDFAFGKGEGELEMYWNEEKKEMDDEEEEQSQLAGRRDTFQEFVAHTVVTDASSFEEDSGETCDTSQSKHADCTTSGLQVDLDERISLKSPTLGQTTPSRHIKFHSDGSIDITIMNDVASSGSIELDNISYPPRVPKAQLDQLGTSISDSINTIHAMEATSERLLLQIKARLARCPFLDTESSAFEKSDVLEPAPKQANFSARPTATDPKSREQKPRERCESCNISVLDFNDWIE